MNKNKYRIGDVVKYIFFSYYMMVKSEYISDHLLEDGSPEKDYIMLGGEYKVLDIRQSRSGMWEYKLLYKDDDYFSWAPETLLRRTEEVKKCPYKIGDKVVFNPENLKNVDRTFRGYSKDLEVISGGEPNYHFEEAGRIYIVRRVINSFYIFVETEGEKLWKFPFRWDDFRLV